jgi:arsenate reductase-like glutaredoxin family protein
MSCRKTQEFLEQNGVSAVEAISAGSTRIGADDALKLIEKIKRIVAVRGAKVVVLDLTSNRPSDETILSHIIGPTGNLRAPTARIGPTLIVGFNKDAYVKVLGL